MTLPPPPFLGGGSHEEDPAGDPAPRQDPPSRDGRADAHGRDEIVAAGMADFGQGVVFGEDGYRRPRLALGARRLEGGLEAPDTPLYVKTLGLHDGEDALARLDLVEGRLGIGMEVLAQVFQSREALVDRFHDPRLENGAVLVHDNPSPP